MMAQQRHQVARCTIPDAKPHHLRRRAPEHTQPMEVLVLRHQETPVFPCELPHAQVSGAALTEQPNVECMREDVRERDDERLGQLFIKQQPHGLRRRHAEGATLALGGVREAGPDIIGGQLREPGQHLSVRHAAGQICEDVAHGDARAFDARLAKANLGIYDDAIQGAHTPSLRQAAVSPPG